MPIDKNVPHYKGRVLKSEARISDEMSALVEAPIGFSFTAPRSGHIFADTKTRDKIRGLARHYGVRLTSRSVVEDGLLYFRFWKIA